MKYRYKRDADEIIFETNGVFSNNIEPIIITVLKVIKCSPSNLVLPGEKRSIFRESFEFVTPLDDPAKLLKEIL